MIVLISQVATIALHVHKRRLARRERQPLLLML